MYFYEQIRSNERNYLYCQFDTDFNFPLHLHRSFEFMYVQDGNMNIQIGNKNYSLQKNKAALIFPGQLHAYSTKEYSKSFLCIFSVDYIYDFYNLVKGKTADNPTFLFDSSSCLNQLINSDKNSFTVKSALYNIAGQFRNNCSLTDTADENLELLENIINYVQKHFNEQLSLKQLAKKLGYHYNYISSYINENIGTNFCTLVNMFRIDYACELLTEKKYTVTEISQKCGFENVRSFNRNFKFLHNCTPSEYVKFSENINTQ